MSEEKEEKPETEGRFKTWEKKEFAITLTPTFTNTYANNVRLGFTSWDMWLAFGEVMGEKDGKLQIAQQCRIVMSIQHAKAFYELLKNNIEEFEKAFGEIHEYTLQEMIGGEAE